MFFPAMRRAARLLALAAPWIVWGLLLPAAAAAHGERGDAIGPDSVPAPPGAPAVDLRLGAGSGHGVPWDRLTPEAYATAREVVGAAPVFREVRNIGFRCRKGVLDFLFDHPEFAANAARLVREGRYRVRQVSDGYEVDDGAFAQGRFRPIFAEGGRRAFYLEGRWAAPLLPALSGRGLLLLDARHVDAADGVSYCEIGVAGYVTFDTALTEAVGTLSRGLSEARVDRKVRRFFHHVAALNRRAHDDPEGLVEDLGRQPGLPAERLARFRELLLAGLPPSWSEAQRFSLLDSQRVELELE
jgi:hypothetical protein